MNNIGFIPADGIVNEISYPNPSNATETRALFMAMPNQIKEYINNILIPTINADLSTKAELNALATALASVALGQIPDGTVTAPKLSAKLQAQALNYQYLIATSASSAGVIAIADKTNSTNVITDINATANTLIQLDGVTYTSTGTMTVANRIVMGILGTTLGNLTASGANNTYKRLALGTVTLSSDANNTRFENCSLTLAATSVTGTICVNCTVSGTPPSNITYIGCVDTSGRTLSITASAPVSIAGAPNTLLGTANFVRNGKLATMFFTDLKSIGGYSNTILNSISEYTLLTFPTGFAPKIYANNLLTMGMMLSMNGIDNGGGYDKQPKFIGELEYKGDNTLKASFYPLSTAGSAVQYLRLNNSSITYELA